MEALLVTNWFDAIQALGIIAGFGLATAAFRLDAKSRRFSNLLAVHTQHRDIWSQLFSNPELSRILSLKLDLVKNPVTWAEEMFVTFLILHVRAVFEGSEQKLFTAAERTVQDVGLFFSRPIPEAVWENARFFQDKAFVRFLDDCRGKAVSLDSEG